MRVPLDVRGDDRVVRVLEIRGERAAGGGLAVGGVDVLDGDLAPQPDDEIGQRPRRDGRAHRDAVDLALQIRQHEPDRAGRARGRRDEVDRRRPSAPEILVGQVEDLLVVRVRVDRRHESLLDREGVVQDLGERRDAIRRARCVRDDVMLLGVVRVVVHAEHDRHVRIGRGRRDHNLLRAGVDVFLRALAVGEEPGRLDHQIDVEIAPGQPCGIALGEDLQLGLPRPDHSVADLDVLLKLTEDGVVLQEVSHRLRVAKVVDGDDLELAAAL